MSTRNCTSVCGILWCFRVTHQSSVNHVSKEVGVTFFWWGARPLLNWELRQKKGTYNFPIVLAICEISNNSAGLILRMIIRRWIHLLWRVFGGFLSSCLRRGWCIRGIRLCPLVRLVGRRCLTLRPGWITRMWEIQRWLFNFRYWTILPPLLLLGLPHHGPCPRISHYVCMHHTGCIIASVIPPLMANHLLQWLPLAMPPLQLL